MGNTEEIKKSIAEQRHGRAWILILGVFLALFTEVFFAFSDAGHGFGGEKIPITPSFAYGYQQADDVYIMQDTAAWMDFVVQDTPGYLEIEFGGPLGTNMKTLLYYSDKGEESYSQYKALSRFLMRNTTKAVFPLSGQYVETMRLHLNGSFVVKEIRIGRSVSAGDITPAMILAQVQPVRFLAAALFFYLALFAAVHRRKRRRADPNRLVWLDGVRVLATFFVLGVHVVEPAIGILDVKSPAGMAMNGLVLLLLTCNLLFILISGALLLPYREETVWAFYKKRAFKVILPFLVYGVFYLRLMCASRVDIVTWLAESGKDVLDGGIQVIGPHLWLIYEIIALYIIAPFLRYMLKDMPEKTEKCLALLVFVFLGIRSFELYSGQSVNLSVFLGSWPGIFLMGYFLTRPWMRRYDGLLTLLGALSLIFSVHLSRTRPDYKDIACNCSILMLFMTSSLFVLFIRCQKLLKPIGAFLGFLGRYSYSMLLVHLFVLDGVVRNGLIGDYFILDRQGLFMKGVGQIILPFFWTCALSLLISIAVDHTVIPLVESAFSGLSARLAIRRNRKQSPE